MNSRLLKNAVLFPILFFWISSSLLLQAVDPNPPQPDQIALPPAPQHVEFRKDLLSKHPRIFIDAAGVEAFRKKMADPNMAPLLTSFLHQADEVAAETPPDTLPNKLYEVCKIGRRLSKVAFAYLVTRKPEYLEGSRKWIHAVLSYPKWDDDPDRPSSEVTFGLALAYDWLYSDLTPEEHKQIEAALLQHGRLLLDRSAKAPNNYWAAGYLGVYTVINHTGISTAAMALYDTDPEEMQRWLDYTRSRFQTTYQNLAMDGGYHEGPPHLTFATTGCLQYIESLHSISGEDLSDMPYLKDMTKRILDIMVMPDGRNLANFDDCDPLGVPPDDEIYVWLGSRNKDGHAEWLRQKMRKQFASDTAVISPFALLWFDPSVSPKPPDDLPTVGVYPDLGEVEFRSSWKDDAAVVIFRCGPPGGSHVVEIRNALPHCAFSGIHYHPNANSFLFWSEGEWRVGNPAGYTLDKKTHAENVWMVGDHGQRGGGKAWFASDSYFVPGVAQPHLVRVASSPVADYVIGEAAPAYEPECKLTEFTRHLLFVKGSKPYVVVYDRLRASEPKSWASYLHTFGKIDVADNKSFSSAGSPVPGSTATYGTVLGPSAITLDSHPLSVLGFPRNQLEDRGFELVAQPQGTSESTWLITVVGVEKNAVTLNGSDPAPSIKVGNDQIVWDAEGNVSLNNQPIEGNLIKR